MDSWLRPPKTVRVGLSSCSIELVGSLANVKARLQQVHYLYNAFPQVFLEYKTIACNGFRGKNCHKHMFGTMQLPHAGVFASPKLPVESRMVEPNSTLRKRKRKVSAVFKSRNDVPVASNSLIGGRRRGEHESTHNSVVLETKKGTNQYHTREISLECLAYLFTFLYEQRERVMLFDLKLENVVLVDNQPFLIDTESSLCWYSVSGLTAGRLQTQPPLAYLWDTRVMLRSLHKGFAWESSPGNANILLAMVHLRMMHAQELQGQEHRSYRCGCMPTSNGGVEKNKTYHSPVSVDEIFRVKIGPLPTSLEIVWGDVNFEFAPQMGRNTSQNLSLPQLASVESSSEKCASPRWEAFLQKHQKTIVGHKFQSIGFFMNMLYDRDSCSSGSQQSIDLFTHYCGQTTDEMQTCLNSRSHSNPQKWKRCDDLEFSWVFSLALWMTGPSECRVVALRMLPWFKSFFTHGQRLADFFNEMQMLMKNDHVLQKAWKDLLSCRVFGRDKFVKLVQEVFVTTVAFSEVSKFSPWCGENLASQTCQNIDPWCPELADIVPLPVNGDSHTFYSVSE
jgi:hypothetical protein